VQDQQKYDAAIHLLFTSQRFKCYPNML